MKNGHGSLYLYQPPNEFRVQALKKNELFFAYPSGFNDPYDCDFEIKNDLDGVESNQRHEIQAIKSLLSGYYEEHGKWDAYILGGTLRSEILAWQKAKLSSDELCEKIESYFKNEIGVRCFFSEKPKSVPMWAHYAGNHSGFCVQYSSNNQATPVNYSTKKPYFYLSEFLFSPRNISNQILKNKDSAWAHEKEKRLLLLPKNEEKIINQGFFCNIGDNLLNMKVEAIYLGNSIDSSIENGIRDYAKANEIRLYKCIKSADRSIFEFDEVINEY